MKHLKRFAIALCIIVAIVLIAAIFLPANVHIEDSTTINVSAKYIFPKVNELKAWEQWSPFLKEDSKMTSVYEGPRQGVGAVQHWKSTVNGDGSMSIIESTPYSHIKMKLDFTESGTAYSDWTFVPEGKATKVSWSVDISDLAYPLGRIFGLFMTSVMHTTFQSGLASLKSQVESEYAKMMVYRVGKVSMVDMEAWQAIAIKDSGSCDNIGEIFGSAIGEVEKYVGENKIEKAGSPYAFYYLWDEKANRFRMEAGLPVKSKVPVTDRLRYIEYPACRAVTATHYGSFETLYFTYAAIEKYILDNNLTKKGPTLEVYKTDTETEPDFAKWETVVYFPVD